MRRAIWKWLLIRHPEGIVLPRWLLIARVVLYPLDFFYWRMSQTRGYQWQTDTWLIEGVAYSAQALRWMAKAQGEIYRIRRTGDTVTLERVTA